jgi:aspartate/methionine/tyrosine aminotransferase
VSLKFGQTWELDLQQLLDALTPDTRAVFINSPNNPTGWVITPAQQEAILAHCRRHGIWIMADDVYERLVYTDAPGGRRCAPSFLDIAEPDDRLISANSFSKSWLMTGWRLGWVVAPAAMTADLGKLIEYNTSCAPGFVQRAGIVAIERGEEVVEHSVARYQAARDFLYDKLNAEPFRRAGITSPRPHGAMYLFFRVEGETDTLALCKRLVAEAGLGLAPGIAFGAEGEGYIRWCFASSLARLADGVDRLERFLLSR